MAECVASKEREIKPGEPITFSNKCKSVFSVGTGITFHEDGKYIVTVQNNRITVENYYHVPREHIEDKLSDLRSRCTPGAEKFFNNNQYGLIKIVTVADYMKRHGKWITTGVFDDCVYAECDKCNVKQVFYHGKPLTNYCPNCESDMR